jgi:hypothetical protein
MLPFAGMTDGRSGSQNPFRKTRQPYLAEGYPYDRVDTDVGGPARKPFNGTFVKYQQENREEEIDACK